MASQGVSFLSQINTPIDGYGMPHNVKGDRFRFTNLQGRFCYVKNPTQYSPLAIALRQLSLELNNNLSNIQPWDDEQLELLRAKVQTHVQRYERRYCAISQFFNYCRFGSVNKYASEIYNWIDTHKRRPEELNSRESTLKLEPTDKSDLLPLSPVSLLPEKAAKQKDQKTEIDRADIERAKDRKVQELEERLIHLDSAEIVHQYVSENNADYDPVYHKILNERARAGLLSHVDALKASKRNYSDTLTFTPTGEVQIVYKIPLIVAISAMHKLRLNLSRENNEFPNKLAKGWLPAWERIITFVSTGVLKEDNVPHDEVVKLVKVAVHLEVHNLPFDMTKLLLNNFEASTLNLDVDINRSTRLLEGPFAPKFPIAHVIPAYVTPSILQKSDNEYIPHISILGVLQMARPLVLMGEFKELEKRFTLHFDQAWEPTPESIKKLQFLADVFSIEILSITRIRGSKEKLKQILLAFPRAKFEDARSTIAYIERHYKEQDSEFYSFFTNDLQRRYPKAS